MILNPPLYHIWSYLVWYFSTMGKVKNAMSHVSRNQLNQKFDGWGPKGQDMLYTLIRPLIREPFGLEVWMQHRPSLILVQNIHLNLKGSWDSNHDLFVTLAIDTMLRNQLNQKFKLIVEVPWYVIYSNTTCGTGCPTPCNFALLPLLNYKIQRNKFGVLGGTVSLFFGKNLI